MGEMCRIVSYFHRKFMAVQGNKSKTVFLPNRKIRNLLGSWFILCRFFSNYWQFFYILKNLAQISILAGIFVQETKAKTLQSGPTGHPQNQMLNKFGVHFPRGCPGSPRKPSKLKSAKKWQPKSELGRHVSAFKKNSVSMSWSTSNHIFVNH